ncbi:MAG: response regulator [Verrucomicrobiaceae bacterium]
MSGQTLSNPEAKKVILLVEDHHDYRGVVSSALMHFMQRCEVLEAESVAEALGVLGGRHDVDVIVSDMTLPDGTVPDLLERARPCLTGGTRVVVISNHSNEVMQPLLARGDVDACVTKEQGLKELARVVAGLITAPSRGRAVAD